MMFSMDWDKKSGWMVRNMKETIIMEQNRVMESSHFWMGQCTLEIS